VTVAGSNTRFLVMAIVLCAASFTPMEGQAPTSYSLRISSQSRGFQLTEPHTLASSGPPVRGTSYRAEGGGIGAGLLGLLGVVTAAGLCSDSETTNDSCFGPVTSFGLLGAGVGFTIGALVGARFRRH
jgi:hypothetical protein